MNSYTTLSKLLKEMSENISLVKEGDILETIKTLYPEHDIPKEKKNIVVEGIEMTKPIALSKQAKKILRKDKSLLINIYNESSRGDLIKVIKIKGNKIFCENLSIKKGYDNKLIIDKLDILKGDFKLVQRGASKMLSLLEQ